MKRLILFLSFLTLSASAHAGFMIEPYLGYEMGNWKYLGNSSGTTDSGVQYGARLGYGILGFSFGGEYDGTSLTYDQTGQSNVSGSGSDYGIYASFKFPVILRIYGEYMIASSLSATQGGSSETFKGSGTRFGVGFTGLPFIEINLEFISRDYSKLNGTSITGGDFTNGTYALNVSLPLP